MKLVIVEKIFSEETKNESDEKKTGMPLSVSRKNSPREFLGKFSLLLRVIES